LQEKSKKNKKAKKEKRKRESDAAAVVPDCKDSGQRKKKSKKGAEAGAVEDIDRTDKKKKENKNKKNEAAAVEDIDRTDKKNKETKKKQKKKDAEEKTKKRKADDSNAPAMDVSKEEETAAVEDPRPKKKQKKNIEDDKVPVSIAEDMTGVGGGTAAKAFKRVNAEEWLGKKGSWDNSYVGTFGQDGWGYKAQMALGQVRGKDFRHEKTKKKRGSYRGGEINATAVCSYKFESDDE